MQEIRNRILKLFKAMANSEPTRVLFEIFWRVSILALPWQTRWFGEAELAGWPWEQGRWVFYAAWIPMAATIIFGWMDSCRENETKKAISRGDKVMAWVAGFIFIFSFLTAASYVATAQWFVQVGLLVVFCHMLGRMSIPVKSLTMWFVVSLLPQAALAYWQYAVQRVDSVSWLGIAFQSPKQLGVSVVEFADQRYLRAYGGMPHPNILGGWLAVGVLVCWQAAWKAAHKYEAFAWSAASAILGGALLLTYSRSAFLALAVGLAITITAIFVKRKDERFSVQFGIFAMTVMLAFAGILAFTQRDVLLARADSGNRLVEQSGSARWQSLVDGWQVFKSRPLQGSGPNAELARLARSRMDTEVKKLRQPLESPHNTFLLLLVNFGVLGAVASAWTLWRFRRALLRRWWMLPPLVVLASFDHYVWSYWSGMCLVAMVWIASFGSPKD
ncbi:O-antigen ligase family protein [Candidatus Uhrbacteria bacterium]|nr:O-antigen ligase family protein [Candidatus Uhrbacteria bacterium]